jgi:hypothetical protein
MSTKSKKTKRTAKARADSLQRLVRHAGDCSCYRYGCNICDCGALRRRVSAGTASGNHPIWEAWAIHTAALESASVSNVKVSDPAL